MRTGSQPVVVGLPENPYPGIEGITTWKASDALPPCAVGSVSGPMSFSCSTTEPGPAVADDQRKRVLVLRANVDEVDVQPVDLGDEVRDGVQPRLALAPVVLGRPVASEVLHERERHALRVIVDGLLFGPARGRDSGTQVVEIPVADLDRERPDRCDFRRSVVMTDMWVSSLGVCDSHEAGREARRDRVARS